MPAFFPAFAQAMGQQIEYSRALEVQQQDLQDKRTLQQLRQSEIADSQLAREQKRQQMQAERTAAAHVSAFMQAAQAGDQAKIDDPANSAKLFSQAASMSFADGAFSLGKHYEDLAKEKLGEAKTAEDLVLKQKQDAKEAFGAAAIAFDGSAESASNLAKAAVRAGVNPAEIPPPNSPEFAAFAKKHETEGMSTKEILASREKAKEAAERERYHAEELKRQKQRDADDKADKARRREETARHDRELEQLRKSTEKRLETKAASPAKQSVSETNTINAVVGSAAEAVRGLRVIQAMPAGQTAGAFSGISSGEGIISSLEAVGANKVTPESMQLYQTASAGLGLELGRVLTLGGGRGVNQAQIKEFQNMTTVHPGDTEYEAMFKLANAADIVRNRLSTLPDSQNPKVLKQQREAEALLQSIPTPEDVIRSARKSGKAGAKLLKSYATMGEAAGALQSGEVDAHASGKPNSPALPSGWSVKEH